MKKIIRFSDIKTQLNQPRLAHLDRETLEMPPILRERYLP